MLRISITPFDSFYSRDTYQFIITYTIHGREYSWERIMSTGEPDSAFDAMFENARREIRKLLPALRLGGPNMFHDILDKVIYEMENKLISPISNPAEKSHEGEN
jgi:hypothetical protein